MIFVLTFGVRSSQLAATSHSSKKKCKPTSGAKRFPRASSPKSEMCRPSSSIRVFKPGRSLGHPPLRASVSSADASLGVDNGPEFTGKMIDLLVHLNGVTLDFSRPGEAARGRLHRDLQRPGPRRVDPHMTRSCPRVQEVGRCRPGRKAVQVSSDIHPRWSGSRRRAGRPSPTRVHTA
jgi:hypothetical protein